MKAGLQHVMRAVWLLLIVGGLPVPATAVEPPVIKPKSITVVLDDNYPPFAFRNQAGELQGILIDQWRLWTDKTGIQASLRGVEAGFARISAGEYRAIERKWFGYQVFRANYLRYAAIGLAAVLGIMLGLVVWNHLLQRRVWQKTVDLEKEIAVSHEREEALRDSEEKFRQFVEHFPGLVFIKDSSLKTVLLSKMFEKLLGKPLPELVGKTNKDLFPTLASKMNRDDREVFQLDYGEFREIEEAYRDRVFLSYKFPVAYKGEKMLGGFTLDITERKQAEFDRRKLEVKAHKTQKLESLGVLAGGIAHDFNNILTSILGNLELAQNDLPADSPARECLSEAEKAAHRAADLSRQMLAYSGRGRFVINRINLNDLLKEMSHRIEVSIAKTTKLEMQLAPNLPPINADVTQLRQVIMNLIVNAAEAVGDQPGTITVTTRAQLYDLAGLADNCLHDPLPEGRYVGLEIADTGCGMDKETMVKIFDPFFTTKFTGRGLGLPTVLGIVRGHQGAIKVHSQTGHGATFQILLPAAEGAAAAVAAATPPQTVWHGEGTILLVDDEDGVRITGKRMLERLGFQVLTASHGREALVVFKQHPDDIRCVLLDLTMPHMNGEETLRELRKISPDVRVILASGYDEQEINERFKPTDLAGFVHKPFSLDHLAQALQGAISAAPKP